jgi:hypothetical protein
MSTSSIDTQLGDAVSAFASTHAGQAVRRSA